VLALTRAEHPVTFPLVSVSKTIQPVEKGGSTIISGASNEQRAQL
jgi:hypothetical protein